MGNLTQGNLLIEDNRSGFQSLWTEYSDIATADVPKEALSAVNNKVHETSRIDPFLLKLRYAFETNHAHLTNRVPVASLDTCLSENLRRSTHDYLSSNGT